MPAAPKTVVAGPAKKKKVTRRPLKISNVHMKAQVSASEEPSLQADLIHVYRESISPKTTYEISEAESPWLDNCHRCLLVVSRSHRHISDRNPECGSIKRADLLLFPATFD